MLERLMLGAAGPFLALGRGQHIQPDEERLRRPEGAGANGITPGQ
jgi:hypothetical protein